MRHKGNKEQPGQKVNNNKKEKPAKNWNMLLLPVLKVSTEA
jgi:hypothetical protein